jgi:hypothetical protein
MTLKSNDVTAAMIEQSGKIRSAISIIPPQFEDI